MSTELRLQSVPVESDEAAKFRILLEARSTHVDSIMTGGLSRGYWNGCNRTA